MRSCAASLLQKNTGEDNVSLKNTLTNESLNKRFDNPFALVNYAISLARGKILRGEGVESNPANDVLELIAENRDHSNKDDDEEDEYFENEDE